VLAAAHLHGQLEVLLPVVPLLLLVVSLLFGIYPGCDAIVRLAERAGSRRRFGSAKGQAQPRPPLIYAASGGLLIAFGLARRPPPLAS
jgi:hypothetical protein